VDLLPPDTIRAKKQAVITGGAKGIGAGTARELTADGWHCIILDADPAGQGVADELGCTFVRADVTQPERLREVFADAAARFGPLHGLVNSAGINRTGPSAELAADDWQRVIDIDLSGTFYACQAAYPHLAPGAAIVNLASVFSMRALPGRVAYAAAKHGVVGITRVLAVEWAERPIRVNAVAPSWTDTPLIRDQVAAGTIDLGVLEHVPFRRLARVEDVTGAIAFLLGDKATFITGQTLYVDGGYTWAG
jgi:NAD(P)-dependent dehydrogenase (short-subunit alcohol dehydrogenase family)